MQKISFDPGKEDMLMVLAEASLSYPDTAAAAEDQRTFINQPCVFC